MAKIFSGVCGKKAWTLIPVLKIDVQLKFNIYEIKEQQLFPMPEAEIGKMFFRFFFKLFLCQLFLLNKTVKTLHEKDIH